MYIDFFPKMFRDRKGSGEYDGSDGMPSVSAPTTQLYKLREEVLVVSPVTYHLFLFPRFKALCLVYNSLLALGTVTSSTVKKLTHLYKAQVIHGSLEDPFMVLQLQ